MLKSYLSIAWRKLVKNRISSIINIAGLCVGIAALLLISAHVINELSYDNFHDKKDQIYRVQLKRYMNNVLSTEWAWGCAAIGPALKENFPEVENYVIMSWAIGTVRYEDMFFKEPRGYFASQDYFKVFSIPIIKGHPDEMLRRPNTVALSKSTARKYFKNADPIGKTIKTSIGVDYEVTGIFEDFPDNSHMKPDLLFSFETLLKLQGQNILTAWQRDYFATYVLLRPNTNMDLVEAKIPALVQKTIGKDLERLNAGMEFYFMPLTDIHLDSHFIAEFEPNGSRQSVYFLIVIAALIIMIAWINHVNLSTASASERAREIGLRKTIGSSRWQIIFQFYLESFLVNLASLVLAVVLVLLIRPWFTSFSGYKINLSHLVQWNFWAPVAAAFLCGIFLSGLYPALVISNYQTISVLKGKVARSSGGLGLRRALVVFQFLITAVLLTCTLVVYNQITFMQKKEIGVDLDQILVLQTSGRNDSTVISQYGVLETQLSQLPEVSGMATSSAVPGGPTGWTAGEIRLATQTERDGKQYQVIAMDHDFIDVYGVKLIAGRKFLKESPLDNNTIIVNESAMHQLGYDKPEELIDKDVFFWGKNYRIIGVVANFHQESPKKAYDAILFRCMPKFIVFYSIRFQTDDISTLVTKVKSQWEKLFPEEPFDYYFLDEHYEKQYTPDLQFGKIVGLFSLLAIVVACIGLFGLTSLSLTQRTKEIGVRKVLGATVSNLALLMGRDFLLLVTIAIFLATPISWWVITYWLQNFATRIDLSLWVFTFPAIVVVVIAIMTIAYHTLKAAYTNPVKSLKYE